MFSLRRLLASHARSIGAHKRLQSSAAAAAAAGRKIVVEGDQKASASGIYEAPFARARLGPFFQAEPQLGNQFTEDVTLQKYLKRHLPPKVILNALCVCLCGVTYCFLASITPGEFFSSCT